MKLIDLQKQTATVTSTATITLGAAVGTLRTVAQAIDAGEVVVGDVVCMFRRNPATGAFESGLHRIDSATQLTRQSVTSSSNNGGPVDFGGATIEVYSAAPAALLVQLAGIYDIAFSQSVPLSRLGDAYMASYTVTGALTFTPAASATRGARVYLRLTADGSNVPNFSAFKTWGDGSTGYDNRAGIVNQVWFFYDGYDNWVSISQEASATATVTAPAAPTIGTLVAGNGYVDVYFQRNYNGGSAVLDSTATLSTGQTATGASSPIRVTAPNGTAVTATVKDRNVQGSSAPSGVSNSVTPSTGVSYPRLINRSADLTENGSGPYTYGGTGASFGDPTGGVLNRSLQANTDGTYSHQFTGYVANSTSGGAQFMLGVSTSSTPVAFSSLPLALFVQSGSSGNIYAIFKSGNFTGSSVTPADGDIVRIRRTGDTIFAEVSKNGGTSYTIIGSLQTNGAFYLQNMIGGGAGTITNLQTSGLV